MIYDILREREKVMKFQRANEKKESMKIINIRENIFDTVLYI